MRIDNQGRKRVFDITDKNKFRGKVNVFFENVHQSRGDAGFR